MAKSINKEKHNDMPILFFIGLGVSAGLIYLLTRKKSSPGAASATLNGILDDDGGAENQVSFEFGQTTSLGSATPVITATSGTSFSAKLTNLARNMTYYFRAKAVGPGGMSYGEIMTFSTYLPTGV